MTIYELAKLARVAPSTASKAINGTGQIGPDTRAHVLAIARKYRFHPSHSARALSLSKTDNLGVLVLRHFSGAVIGNPFNTHIIEGIETAAVESGYNIIFSVIPWKLGAKLPALPKMAYEKSADGIILIGSMPPKFVRELAALKLPLACVDLDCGPGLADRYLIDNAGGARRAAEYLAGMGHTRIGMAAGPPKDPSFSARRRGFLEGLESLGLKAALVVEDRSNLEGDDSWMAPLVSGPSRPSAVFCCNDDHAIRLQALALKAGLRLPEDLSMLGFDDIDSARVCRPALSTLKVDKPRLGSEAAAHLVRRIQDPKLPLRTLVQSVTLIPRESVQPLASCGGTHA